MSGTSHIAAPHDSGRRGLWQEDASGLVAKRGQSDRSEVSPAQLGDVHVFTVPATAAKPVTVAQTFPAWEEFMRQAAGRCVLVDGGLATELERRGADLNDPLWSAKCLLDETQAGLIREVRGERGGVKSGGSERGGRMDDKGRRGLQRYGPLNA